MNQKDNSVARRLKRIFSQTQNDILTLDEVYKAAGIDDMKPQIQKMWIANRVKEFLQDNLVEQISDANFNLEKIQLTQEGKRVLGRIQGDSEKPTTNSHTDESMGNDKKDKNIISLKEVIEVFSELSRSAQGNKFSIDIKLKEGIVSIHMV